MTPDFKKILEELRSFLSLDYNDAPFPDWMYDAHTKWIGFLHDYYWRVEHVGHVQKSIEVAKKEPVIFISNHVMVVEALLIGYYLFKHQAGRLGALIFKEVFRVPFLREFNRTVQSRPVSIEEGVQTLQKRHVLIFPEGMNFKHQFKKSNYVGPLHTGFLRIAENFLKKNRKKEVYVIPVGHVGTEWVLRYWFLEGFLLKKIIQPFWKYPVFLIPKFPFLLPSKIIMNWGPPVRVTLSDLKTEDAVFNLAEKFRGTLKTLKEEARSLK